LTITPNLPEEDAAPEPLKPIQLQEVASIQLIDQQSEIIRFNGQDAILLAIFLRNLRATFIAILSLPISILATIAFLNQMDYTLNMMTLGGLAVAVGRIVDDSIVIMENIFRWKREHPSANHQELVINATKDVATAVISSTAVTIVVFLPLAFLDDLIGEFFRPFAAAVVVSILVSLFVSLALIPAISKNASKEIAAKGSIKKRQSLKLLKHAYVPFV